MVSTVTNRMQGKPEKRPCGRVRCVVLLMSCLSAVAGNGEAQTFSFTQRSDPPGLIDIDTVCTGGTMVSTTNAPQRTTGFRFAYWDVQGTEQRQGQGHALNPAVFQILDDTEAVAHYYLEGQDSNSNNVPDWWELHCTTGLVGSSSQDLDGDGFDVLEEYFRDYHPGMFDEVTGGGLCLGASVPLQVIPNTNLVRCSWSSTPSGLITAGSVVTNQGSVLSMDDAFGTVTGYRFCYWTFNGVTQTDSQGRATGWASSAVQSNGVFEAVFVPQAEDANSNAVPDWFELNHYGSLVDDPDSDSDGDGIGLLEEYRRDYCPGIFDEVAGGGLCLGASASLLVIPNTNLALCSWSSIPSGLITDGSVVTNQGSVIRMEDAFGTVTGHRFAYWTFNGVIQTDGQGRATGWASSAVPSNGVFEAVFVPEAEDANSNAVPDWFELNHYGSLVDDPDSDSDGDGIGLLEEYRRDYCPGMFDEVTGGGICLGASAPLQVIPNTNLVRCSWSSTPSGLITAGSIVTNQGSVLSMDDAFGTVTGYRFCYWTFNGLIETDRQGRATGWASSAVPSNGVFEAVFVPEAADVNSNAVPDWFELNHYGSLIDDPASDSDGDGIGLLEEYRRDYCPEIFDQVRHGGLCFHVGQPQTINFRFFPRVEKALVEGVLQSVFTVPQSVTGTFEVAANSSPALGDWDGDLDLDVFVGGANGELRVFENAGSPQVLNLVERTTNFAGIASAWTNLTQVCPALGDWSGDGVADLAIGGDTNVITLIASPGSWEGDALTGALRTNLVCSALVRASPAFGDISGDGWTDLLVLTDQGVVQAYTNTHMPLTPYLLPAFSSNLLGSAVQNATGVTTADVNDDGVLDVLISDDSGNIWEFHGE